MKLVINISIILILALFVLLAPLLSDSQTSVIPLHKRDKTDQFKEPLPPRKTVAIYNFFSHRAVVQELCLLLEEDGRRIEFFNAIDLLSKSRTECRFCNGFFSLFRTACRPKLSATKQTVKQKQLESQDNNSEQIVQTAGITKLGERDPSLELLTICVELFTSMAENEITKGELALTLRQLRDSIVVSDPRGEDYFGTLFFYIDSAVKNGSAARNLPEGLPKEPSVAKDQQTTISREELDAIFE